MGKNYHNVSRFSKSKALSGRKKGGRSCHKDKAERRGKGGREKRGVCRALISFGEGIFRGNELGDQN